MVKLQTANYLIVLKLQLAVWLKSVEVQFSLQFFSSLSNWTFKHYHKLIKWKKALWSKISMEFFMAISGCSWVPCIRYSVGSFCCYCNLLCLLQDVAEFLKVRLFNNVLKRVQIPRLIFKWRITVIVTASVIYTRYNVLAPIEVQNFGVQDMFS